MRGDQVFLAEALTGTTELSSRPERTRISYFALLATSTCAALRREPHADRQSHGSPQEIRGSVVERSAVLLGNSRMLLPILFGLHLPKDRNLSTTLRSR